MGAEAVGFEDWLRGLEATYTEHGSITSERPENSSKSGARNRLDLQLLTTVALERGVLKQPLIYPEGMCGHRSTSP
jgi:hypothetical protein